MALDSGLTSEIYNRINTLPPKSRAEYIVKLKKAIKDDKERDKDNKISDLFDGVVKMMDTVNNIPMTHLDLEDSSEDVHPQYLNQGRMMKLIEPELDAINSNFSELKQLTDLSSQKLIEKVKVVSNSISDIQSKVDLVDKENKKSFNIIKPQLLELQENAEALINTLRQENISSVQSLKKEISRLKESITKKVARIDLPKKVEVVAGDNIKVETTELATKIKYKISSGPKNINILGGGSGNGSGFSGGTVSQPITGNITITEILGETLILIADATSGNITVTLGPAAGLENKYLQVKRKDNSVNSITIDADGSETIDDVLTLSVPTQYDAPKIFCDGTEWHEV